MQFSAGQNVRLKSYGARSYSSFKFLPENLGKIGSTELYDAPLEVSTIFLYRSSLGRMLLESCQLAEWNMQFSAGQDVRLKSYGAQTSFFDSL